MPHERYPFPASFFVQLLCDEPVEGFQIQICKPWRCVIPNRASHRSGIYNLVEGFKHIFIFDFLPQFRFQNVPVDIVKKLPDIQFDKISALFVILEPMRNSLDYVLDSSARNAPAAIRVHSPHKCRKRSLDEHVRHDVVTESWYIQISPLAFTACSVSTKLSPVLRLTVFPCAAFQIIADWFCILPCFCGVNHVVFIIKEQTLDFVIAPLISCAVNDGCDSVFN